MSVAGQPDPSPCSDERHNVEVQDDNDAEQDINETQDVGVDQYNTSVPAPRTEQEDDEVKTDADGALVLKNRSASVPTIGTEETSIANRQVTTPTVKPDCTETNLPFDLNSGLSVPTDHPSICTSDATHPSDEHFEPPPTSGKEPTTHAIQVGDSDGENGFVTATPAAKEPALAVEILDSDCLDTHEDRDLATVVLSDKGKGVDPREHGNATYDPNSIIVPVDTTSGGSGFIELIGVRRDKGKNVDPEERRNGMAKYEPSPSRIDFHDHGVTSFQKQAIPLQPFEPTKAADLNHEPPYDPTLPHLPWHPKISPYRFIVFLIPLSIGTVKAILSQKGSVTTPITLEWISGVVVFLVLFLLGSYETRRDIPKYLSSLFKPDCVDLVWYLAAKLSIQRPEYLSNEGDLEFDPGAFVTSYRILLSAAVVFLGSLKTTFTYSNLSTDAIWVEWFVAAFVTSLLYLVGLYENNSLGLWSSFFRKDRSRFIHMDFIGSAISPPSIIGLAFLLVVYSAQLIPAIKRNARKALPEYIEDSQLPIGPTLSKGTLEEVYLVVVIYIPFVVIYVVFLVLLITQLRGPILTSTSMLPSVIRYHTGRFFGAVKRLAKRQPVERIIYHFVAFGQLLLLVTWNVWTLLFICFVDVTAEGESDLVLPTLSIKIVLYTAMVVLSISSWIIAATGGFGEIRWWPSRDRLSRLVPPSISNATMTKFIQRQVKAFCRLCSSGPTDSSGGNLLIFIAFYLILSIVVFSGGYALVTTGLPRGIDLPLMVAVFMLLAFSVLLWSYIGFKVFPEVFRDVLWRMRPLLHYGFQDFTESVRDSIESYNY